MGPGDQRRPAASFSPSCAVEAATMDAGDSTIQFGGHEHPSAGLLDLMPAHIQLDRAAPHAEDVGVQAAPGQDVGSPGSN